MSVGSIHISPFRQVITPVMNHPTTTMTAPLRSVGQSVVPHQGVPLIISD